MRIKSALIKLVETDLDGVDIEITTDPEITEDDEDIDPSTLVLILDHLYDYFDSMETQVLQ